ncbi:DUF2489 domain-containing protein [Echinimonas agarilytica]|uniref:DUF2489 domain-containing protein n=1 Tax=Echinimonas agarilytica TaxID=1215918 RepID=A0AA41W402_9GAMM|nr:DUF2489 domain-containing protein [Echinimonas agarilytica]MCM2678290.1 DUF2489 domain-containing protein [Echinimonas agarilytica]
MIWFAVAAAVLIVLGLAVYAGKLLFMLKHQTQQQAQKKIAAREKLVARNERLLSSIDTIVRATQQGQCELSEAAIRLCVLMDHLAFETHEEKPNAAELFPSIHGLYDAIRHHPTHDARKQYSKKEIFKLDMERTKFEAEFEKAITEELPTILAWQPALVR